MFTTEEKDSIITLYKKGNSTTEIAQKLNTYPNKINRLLVKHGVKIREKGEAQKLALQKGTAEHPTKGRERTTEEKQKISSKLTSYWDGLDETTYSERVEVSRRVWNEKSEKEQAEMRKSAARAMVKACKEGSKLEKFLKKELTRMGHEVIFHKTGLIENHNLEIDLFLPNLNLIIEIDGPTHFLPIFGEEKLKKVMESDMEKNGLLISKGFTVLRFKYLCKRFGNKHKKMVVERIEKFLSSDFKPGTIEEVSIES
jgi:very-short-patch-repair endonuclease